MLERLAVSDSLQGLLAVLTLPDLQIGAKARVPFQPGKLLGGANLFCADRSESAIYMIDPGTLRVERTYASAPEIEGLALSHNGVYLYALAAGADSVQMLDVGQGQLLNIAHVGLHPRAMAQDVGGHCLAVACGNTCEVVLLDATTLRVCASFPVDGVAVDACFFAGQLMVLCAVSEYEASSIVGAISPDGKWTPWTRLPGLPGAMAPCGGGLLVGHMRRLTMIDAPNGRIRWQTTVTGLPAEIVAVGRSACFADSLDGLVGLVDLRRGTVMRRLRVGEPGGLAVIKG